MKYIVVGPHPFAPKRGYQVRVRSDKPFLPGEVAIYEGDNSDIDAIMGCQERLLMKLEYYLRHNTNMWLEKLRTLISNQETRKKTGKGIVLE